MMPQSQRHQTVSQQQQQHKFMSTNFVADILAFNYRQRARFIKNHKNISAINLYMKIFLEQKNIYIKIIWWYLGQLKINEVCPLICFIG